MVTNARMTVKISLCWILVFSLHAIHGYKPPTQNFTTVTLFTQKLSWNQAADKCMSLGGKLLDLSYYSIWRHMFSMLQTNPWNVIKDWDVEPVWIGLHVKNTEMGEYVYNGDCLPHPIFKLLPNGPAITTHVGPRYNYPDGNGLCMHVSINTSVVHERWYSNYTKAKCSESHRFLCQFEQGHTCTFERFTSMEGRDQSTFDIPDNDVIVENSNLEECEALCRKLSFTWTAHDIKLTEECWVFSMYKTTCTAHLTLHPSSVLYDEHFEIEQYVKICFGASVIDSYDGDINAATDLYRDEPNTTCGTSNNNVIMSPHVIVLDGLLTWNDAFQTCQEYNGWLLNAKLEDEMFDIALQQVIHAAELRPGGVWLGLHEPDPQMHPDLRVTSQCGRQSEFHWAAPPSSDVYDTHLCGLLDTTSLYWRMVTCNQMHAALCQTYNFSYTQTYTLEKLPSEIDGYLGPFDVSPETCKDHCDIWSFDDLQCWSYSTSKLGCTLFFSENPFHFYETVDESIFPEVVKVYHKLLWNYSVKQVGLSIDVAKFIPKSCCDLSVFGTSSLCPPYSQPPNDNTKDSETDCIDFIYSFSIPTCNVSHSVSYPSTFPGVYNISTSPGVYNTSTLPGVYKTSTSPGVYNTSTPPGVYNTSTSPGVYNTSTSPGVYNTSTHPGVYNTSSSPGVYNTSISPGVYKTSTSPGVYNTSTSPRLSYPSTSPGVTYISTSPIQNASIFPIVSNTAAMVTTLTTMHNLKPIYIWPCLCNPYRSDSINMTREEWSKWYTKNNTLERNNTSKYRRSLSSANDDRRSSGNIGLVSALLVGGIIMLIVVSDLSKLVKGMRECFGFRVAYKMYHSRNKGIHVV